MDLANTLIRSVVRAFYDTRHILIVDALFVHSVLHVEDLQVLLSVQTKDLRKLCSRLREDRMIGMNTRLESRDGIARPVNREYFYIPLHPAIDTIKFRISRLTSAIKAQYTPSSERKDWVCLKCKAEYTEMEVLDSVGPEGLECKRCGFVLHAAADVQGGPGADRTGHEKNAKLMAQLDKWLKLLQRIDSIDVPMNDFDTAWEHKIEVPRDKTINPIRQSVAVANAKSAAVSGTRTAKVDEGALKISLTSTEEKSAVEKAEAEARKAALEKQNALPVWHTQSTVSSNSSTLVKPEDSGSIKEEVKQENGDESKPDISGDQLDDEMAAYYAQMAREKEMEAAASTPEEDTSDEEEEEDFEDVGSGISTPNAAYPSSNNNKPESKQPALANGGSSLKRELDSDNNSSTPTTGVETPASLSGSAAVASSQGPAAKKVKIEESPVDLVAVKQEKADNDDDDDDDDEEEFEDV